MPATPVARKKSPGTPPPAAFPRKNSPSSGPSSVICAKKLAQHAIKRQFLAFLSTLGELFRARVRTGPSRANFFAHRTQPRADYETNDTSAATDAGQHETAVTTATEKCAKNTHFSPAKAMAVSTDPPHRLAKAMSVSVGARPARAKATGVSRERFPMCAGYGRSWPGFETTRRATHQRPGAAGVEGAGGSGGHGRASRSTTPSRRLACGDLAGGRARRRPEHQRSHKQQAQSRIPAEPPV